MDDITDSEKFAFQEEAVRKRIREIIEDKLNGKDYDEDRVSQWTNDILEACMEEVCAPRKPFKFVITCNIMQRTGAAIHSSSACFWDTVSDDTVYVSWPKKTTKSTLVCIVTVYAVGFIAGM